MWVQDTTERTLSSLWCSLPWPSEHTYVGRIMLFFMFSPVRQVLEGSQVAAEGTAVLRVCLKGWNDRRRKWLRQGIR